MKIEEKNLKILQNRFYHIYEKIKDCSDDDSVEAIEAKNGEMVPLFTGDNKKIFIHSKFDPLKEAERFGSEIDPSQYNLIICSRIRFCLPH